MSADRVELAVRELVAALRDELRPPPEPPALVDITTAARMISCSRTTLYALMDSGELPSRHVGRRRLVPRAALEAFAAGDR
jgi:excisionase family DNA binding protein